MTEEQAIEWDRRIQAGITKGWNPLREPMPDFPVSTTFIDGIARGPKWIRDEVATRANERCECCKRDGEHMHHIDKDRNNNQYDNLIFLCKKCHYFVHHKMRKDPNYRVIRGRKLRA